MQESFRNGICSNKLVLIVMSVAALAFFCFAAPSAKATQYSVTITAGSGGGCASGNTGTLTISGGTLEFTSTGGCYFGTVGFNSGASTCTSSNCSSLDSLTASTQYGFADTLGAPDNAGGCSSSSACSFAFLNENFQLIIPSVGFGSSSSTHPVNINLGSVGGNTPLSVSFDDPILITPEPASYLLFGSGLLGLGAIIRKKLGRARVA
jgi:hypothetical protein